MPRRDAREDLASIRRLAVLGDRTSDPATIHAALAAELLGALTVDEVDIHHLALVAGRELVVTHMLGGAGRLSRFRARSERPHGVAQVAATHQALRLTSPAEIMAIAPDLALARRASGALLLPVIVEREVEAVVSVVRIVPPEPFCDQEVEVAATLVDQGAVALALVRARAEAGIDTVSGCMNHRAMRQRLVEEIKRAGRYNSPLAVLMLDLDDFKLVNDRHGHQAGDVLLRGVAEALMSEFRAFDCVARYGGDEFVVILPDADLERASAAAQRALDRIDGVPARGEDERTSASIGVAQWRPPMSTDELLAAGDAALLSSKRTGKGRVTTARLDAPSRHAPR
jgi:diguanylate cyclase (GGDEF)-like protein